jgi:predicted DNA-binding transcriptional regulator YafY
MSHNAGVADTSARMLRLLSLLQARRWWPGADLAGRLGVSARTLRRDVDRLRELGYPVRARRGTGGGYELAGGAALPPLGLDEEEAVALIAGLAAAAQGAAVAGITGPPARALAKLARALPGPLRRPAGALAAVTVLAAWDGDGGPGPAPGAAALLAAAQACRESARVAFGYTARGGARTDREAEPHGLVLLGRCWYLVAWDLARHDWRTFRIDRMGPPRRPGPHFAPRRLPAPDAGAFVRDSIQALLAS